MTGADASPGPASSEPSIERVAYLSLHTSPLAAPGTGDAGGMNVYIDELAATMTGRAIDVTVLTRRTDPTLPEVVDRRGRLPGGAHPGGAGRMPSPSSRSPGTSPTSASRRSAGSTPTTITPDILHSHYWLSGWAGVVLKEMLGPPWPTRSIPWGGSRMSPGAGTSRRRARCAR